MGSRKGNQRKVGPLDPQPLFWSQTPTWCLIYESRLVAEEKHSLIVTDPVLQKWCFSCSEVSTFFTWASLYTKDANRTKQVKTSTSFFLSLCLPIPFPLASSSLIYFLICGKILVAAYLVRLTDLTQISIHNLASMQRK